MTTLTSTLQAPRLPQTLRIGPFRVKSFGAQALASQLYRQLALGRRTELFFANTNFVVTCQDFAARFDDPAITVVNDGIGMDLAARLVHGQRFQENLNGTDFIPRLLRDSPLPLRIFLFGARPDVVREASQTIESRFGTHEVVGALSGYGVDDKQVCERIRLARPDVVLVALGNPLQERWILDHAKVLPPALYAGVGALFDFLAERAVRAPVWMRKLHLEWLFRLMQEPKRLWKRYTVDAVRFFRICASARARAS